MVAVHFLDRALPVEDIGRLTLNGDLLVWRQMPALARLCETADAMLRDGFQDDDPLTIEARLPADLFLKRVRALRGRFKQDPAIVAAFKDALIATGLTAVDSYWDPLQLRVVPFQNSHQGRRIMPLPAHRDNWGSNIAQQINWWTPLYPTSAQRTILFYPSLWAEPVGNSSADWDFEILKAMMESGKADSYPVLPVVTEELSAAAAMPIVLQPGDMLAFSGQHLHGSIATEEGIARFSTESRTVTLRHVTAGLAAPNVDGHAPHVVPDWFQHMIDDTPLAEAYRLAQAQSAASVGVDLAQAPSVG
ncbi:MAG: hypothetical protein E6Q98_15295 [Rhodospirillaceae bacterium]|nr:MAG: hypothetical protein E6Q98_15295 [Rhodospirillaceae bacterium]